MGNREEAKRLYLEEQLSPTEIADRLKVGAATVRKWKQRDNWDAKECHVTTDCDTVTMRKVRTRQKIAKAIEEAADLTDREKNFCVAYLGCWNATQAAYAAGYTGTYLSVKNLACELLKKPHIDKELTRLKEIKRMAIMAQNQGSGRFVFQQLHRQEPCTVCWSLRQEERPRTASSCRRKVLLRNQGNHVTGSLDNEC